MNFRPTPLHGLMLVDTTPVTDERGKFDRLFCEREWGSLRPSLHWSQVNLSHTHKVGTIRGMHFQYPPKAEAKLIRCLRGRVFDVAVDLRAGSPTFLHWHGVQLEEGEPTQVFIPEGFAHGFQTLTDDAQLLYFHTFPWSLEHEGRVRYDDPATAIEWPLPVTQISQKDRAVQFLDPGFAGLSV